jgi:hypothetical protein
MNSMGMKALTIYFEHLVLSKVFIPVHHVRRPLSYGKIPGTTKLLKRMHCYLLPVKGNNIDSSVAGVT